MWRPIDLKDVKLADEKRTTDYKSLGLGGIGGAGLISILMSFQNQGIELISKNNVAQQALVASKQQVAIEKIMSNSGRIDRVESDMKDLKHEITEGFKDVKSLVRSNQKEWLTKSEADTAFSQIDRRLNRVENDLDDFRRRSK